MMTMIMMKRACFVTASVMCKKAVEGLDALCLEVTFGKAALIKTRQHADRLARLMVRYDKIIMIR